MINTMIRFSLLAATLILAACAKDPIMLPDEGPTTNDIWQGDYGSVNERPVKISKKPTPGYPVILSVPAKSSLTTAHLRELNDDFKEVPNPKIIGFVYAHFNETGMPVPGYFTAFRLYKENHMALMGEGAAEGVTW